MKSIFSRNNKEELNKENRKENFFKETKKEKQFKALDESKQEVKKQDEEMELLEVQDGSVRWLPIYYDAIKIDGINYGKAVKCFIDDDNNLTFSKQIIDFETTNNIVGFLFFDEQLTQIADEKYINNKLSNISAFLTCEECNEEMYFKVRNQFNKLVDKYLKKESICLNADELFDFNIQLKEILSYRGDDLLARVNAMKLHYKQISQDRKGQRENFMPIFCAMEDDFSMSTISVKCLQGEEGELTFNNDFVLTKGFDLDTLGNVYFDDEFSKELSCDEIEEKLKNINDAILFFTENQSEVEVSTKVYDAKNETTKAFYAVATNYLQKGSPFVNDKDKKNAKLIIEQVKKMTTFDLQKNISKIKEQIDYVYDTQKGIKYFRPRVTKRSTVNGVQSLDLRKYSVDDIKIM